MEREILSIYHTIWHETKYRQLLISDWAQFTSQIEDEYALEKCNSFYGNAIKETNEEITGMYEMLWKLIESKGGVEEFFRNL